MSMSITIKDIARLAGVSHATVSRALRGHPGISPATTARIQAIASEQGYLASTAARSLKTSRTQAVGVILSYIDDPFFSEVLEGIEDILQPRGYSLFVAASHHDTWREKAIVRAMLERRVDGVIICSPPFRPEHSRQFQEYGLPLTVINNQDAEDYQFSIYHDDIEGSRQVARYLLGLGHRRIAYLGNSQAGRSNRDRLSGYKAELLAACQSIPAGYIFQGPDGRPEGGYAGARHFLSLSHPPTAIMCFNDLMALGLLRGLQESGRRIPEDCSVTGFDNIEFSAFLNPPLTTFDQPKYQMGADAANMILELLTTGPEGETPPGPFIHTLHGELLVRSSSGPQKGKTDL
jgi:DNA-binding LacI/PurR family transcriptional regulator